jgi:hypothetical protein
MTFDQGGKQQEELALAVVVSGGCVRRLGWIRVWVPQTKFLQFLLLDG